MGSLRYYSIGTRLNIIMTGLYLILVFSAMFLSYHRQQKLVTKVVINNARIMAGEVTEEMGRVPRGAVTSHRIGDFQQLINRISMRDKYLLRILSTDNRRDEFRPDAHDAEQMAWFAGSDLRESHRVVVKDEARMLVYMRPLIAIPYCLECHGTREAAPAAVRSIYPEGDVFYGHQPGTLMGAVSVSIPMNEIDDEIWQNLRLDVIYRTILFLFIIIVVNVMLRQAILKPLGRFSRDLIRISESGDLAERVSVPPDPDVARVAVAFNGVMDELSRRTEQYRDSELRCRGIFEMAVTPVVTFLEEGTVVVANRAAAELFGISRDELAGTDFYSFLVDGDDLHVVVDDYLQEGGEEIFRQRIKVRGRNGEVEQELAIAASDRAGKLITAVLTAG